MWSCESTERQVCGGSGGWGGWSGSEATATTSRTSTTSLTSLGSHLAVRIRVVDVVGQEQHARAKDARSPPASNHVSRARPDLVRSYGDQLWLDPGEPAARDYSLRVIADVVRRYDIDGVHLDEWIARGW